MKKLINIILILTVFLAFGCKNDNNDQALTPNQDTTIYPGYDEYTDESDIDTTIDVNNTTIDSTNIDDNATIMVEDTIGNVQPATDTDMGQTDKNFYIIVGSYQNIGNAQIRMQYFKNQGYTAEVLAKFGTYNRVSVAKFNEEGSARDELKSLRTKYNDNTFWLLLR